MSVHPNRIQLLKAGRENPGPVIYWMNRDQRVADNWALLYAQEQAVKRRVPLVVAFVLVPEYLNAGYRQYAFMLRGLEEVEYKLSKYRIPFVILPGIPEQELPRMIEDIHAGILVTDFSPLRINRTWRTLVAGKITIPFYEVDAHNIVPCRGVSNKLEYGAYTLRPKIQKLLPEYLVEFPSLKKHRFVWNDRLPQIDWRKVERSLRVDRSIGEVDWLVPGEKAALKILEQFLENRLAEYDAKRNDPLACGQSHLSPYLHFGQISAQRVALEVTRFGQFMKSSEAFLEELIVRRELSDNFCFYNKYYDSVDGFPEWSRQTHQLHKRDTREFVYDLETFEHTMTHDPLWNAAQHEMVYRGTMHGYMRMYWAKKIMEWTKTDEDAMEIAMYLNDKYELDGRDPNGYAGIAWSIGGVHDRAWGDRKIFGKIRYMNFDGCKRKFNVQQYIDKQYGTQ